jgi:hypothetical protein
MRAGAAYRQVIGAAAGLLNERDRATHPLKPHLRVAPRESTHPRAADEVAARAMYFLKRRP